MHGGLRRSSLRSMKHFALFRIDFDPLGMTRIDIEESIKVIFKIIPPWFDRKEITQPCVIPGLWLVVWNKKTLPTLLWNEATKFGAKKKSLNCNFKDLNKNSSEKTQNFVLSFFWFLNGSLLKKIDRKYCPQLVIFLKNTFLIDLNLKKMIDYIIKTRWIWREQREKNQFFCERNLIGQTWWHHQSDNDIIKIGQIRIHHKTWR